MTTALFFAFTTVSAAILAWGLMRRQRVVQYPFLAASVFLGFILPQLLGLRHQLYLPAGGLNKTLVMAVLCLAGLFLGYTLNNRPAKLFWWQFNRRRLIWSSGALSLLGAFFFLKVSELAAEVTAPTEGPWTGVITIFVFFSQFLTMGLAIALLLLFQKPDFVVFSIVAFDLAFYLERIIVKGRRAALVELGLMVIFALWFRRRWLPPRWSIIVLLVLGTLVINSIGDYRSVMLAKDRTTWSGAGLRDVFEIDYVGNLMRLAHGESGNHDLTNAVFDIEAADRNLQFDFGLSHWNGLIQRYVPAQWVGKDFKESLQIDLTNSAFSEFRHVPFTGSTHTGLSDAFQSFWFFGAGKFALIGLILSRWYLAAVRGNLVGQLVLMLTMTPALHAITHSTDHFFVIFIELAVFLLPVLLFARTRVIGHPDLSRPMMVGAQGRCLPRLYHAPNVGLPRRK